MEAMPIKDGGFIIIIFFSFFLPGCQGFFSITNCRSVVSGGCSNRIKYVLFDISILRFFSGSRHTSSQDSSTSLSK